MERIYIKAMRAKEDYAKACKEWTGDAREFALIVQNAKIAGVSRRDLVHEFEFAVTTIDRWAAGEAVPHRRIQKLVVNRLANAVAFIAEPGNTRPKPSPRT